MLPEWVARYIGLEYEDRGRGPRWDCWGLAAKVWADRFGLTLPSYAEHYATAEDHVEIGRLIRGQLGPWREIPLADARAGDGILLRVEGQPGHVGVIVAPPRFLHVVRGANSCVEDYTRPQWVRRVLGVYRHEAMA